MAPRTPLLRPDRYFAERELFLGRVFVVFALVVFAGLGAVYATGYVLAAHVDGTVLVDNPERPPDVFCDDDASQTFDDDGCDAPRQVERNVDTLVWDAIEELAGAMLVGMLLVVAGLTVALHGLSWIAGGTNGVTASFAVTVWGMTPMLFVAPPAFLVLWVTLDPVTLSAASDPGPAFERLIQQLRSLQWLGLTTSAVSSVWGAAIWRYGLEHERGVDGAAATAIAGVVALGVLAFGAL